MSKTLQIFHQIHSTDAMLEPDIKIFKTPSFEILIRFVSPVQASWVTWVYDGWWCTRVCQWAP